MNVFSAREINRSVFILLLSQFHNLLIAEKLFLHSQDVTGSIYFISRAQTHSVISFHCTSLQILQVQRVVKTIYSSRKATLDQQYQDLVDNCDKDQLNLP